ncbi:hypothetical protein CL622_03710 [archaeon]|nr:hypothetical protein [archaeon]
MKPDINICYLITSDWLQLTLASINYIKQFYKSSKYNLRFIIIGADRFSVPKDIIYVRSKCPELPLMYQRAHIPDMLDVSRVIFLDSDTVTTTCISKLWDIDLDNNIIGAIGHYHLSTFKSVVARYSLHFEPFTSCIDLPFFNGGVMLIDCNKWKENGITHKCMELFSLCKGTGVENRNEPGLNVALMNNWKQLDERWNYYPRDNYKKTYIAHYYGNYSHEKHRHNVF